MTKEETVWEDRVEFTKALSKVLRLAEKHSWYWLWPAQPSALKEARDRMRKAL